MSHHHHHHRDLVPLNCATPFTSRFIIIFSLYHPRPLLLAMPNSRPFRGGQWKCVNLFPAAFGGTTTATAAVLASQPSLAIYQVALSNKAFAGTACWGRRRTANNAKYLQGYCFAATLLLHFRSVQPSWAIPIINSSSSLLFPGRGAVFVGGVNLDNVPG